MPVASVNTTLILVLYVHVNIAVVCSMSITMFKCLLSLCYCVDTLHYSQLIAHPSIPKCKLRFNKRHHSLHRLADVHERYVTCARPDHSSSSPLNLTKLLFHVRFFSLPMQEATSYSESVTLLVIKHTCCISCQDL